MTTRGHLTVRSSEMERLHFEIRARYRVHMTVRELGEMMAGFFHLQCDEEVVKFGNRNCQMTKSTCSPFIRTLNAISSMSPIGPA